MLRFRSTSPIAVLVTAALLALAFAAPLRAQDAQSRLWDSAISGDTVSLLQALAAGAKVASAWKARLLEKGDYFERPRLADSREARTQDAS